MSWSQRASGCARLGRAIADARQRKGWTQAELADIATRRPSYWGGNVTPSRGGVTRSTVAQWEIGNRAITKAQLDAIASELGVEFRGLVSYGDTHPVKAGPKFEVVTPGSGSNKT